MVCVVQFGICTGPPEPFEPCPASAPGFWSRLPDGMTTGRPDAEEPTASATATVAASSMPRARVGRREDAPAMGSSTVRERRTRVKNVLKRRGWNGAAPESN